MCALGFHLDAHRCSLVPVDIHLELRCIELSLGGPKRGPPRLLSKALAASAAPESAPRAPVPLVPELPAPMEQLPVLPGPELGLVALVALLGAGAQGPEQAQALVSVPARAAGPRFQRLAARTWGPRPCART